MKILLITLLLIFSISTKAETITETEIDTHKIKELAVRLFLENALATNFDWSNFNCEKLMKLSLEVATEEYFKDKLERQKKIQNNGKPKEINL